MTAVAELIGRGHQEAYRYRWRFFVACLEEAGERLAEEMRRAAAAVRAASMDAKQWKRWIEPARGEAAAHREIYERMRKERG